MTTVAAQPLIHQDRGKLAALASPGAVAEEEAAAVAGSFGIRHQFKASFRHAIAAGEIRRCCVERMNQCFKLGAAQHAVADHLGRKLGDVAWYWQRHRGHGCRFHQLGRVIRSIVKDKSLRTIGDIDADSLLGVGDGVAQAVGQRDGACGIAARRCCGQFRCG